MSLRTTGSQTVGPFFEIGFGWLYTDEIGAAAASGERVELRGHVYDGGGRPVSDAVLEFWQADAHGRYAVAGGSAEFMGFGRVPTDAGGGFRLRTVKPGRVPWSSPSPSPSPSRVNVNVNVNDHVDDHVRPGGSHQLQAPHLSVQVFMRGLLLPLRTRVYFPGDPANAEDPVLARVPEARRATLIANAQPEGHLDWEIHTQGDREIVCFEF